MKKYSIDEIEIAFFNYDNDGSDDQQGWEKRKKQWKQFKVYLETGLYIDEKPEQVRPEV